MGDPMATDRPLSAVLHDIVGNLQDIIRSEARLAKAEVTQELKKSAAASVMIGSGVLMLGLSGLFVLVAAVAALSLVMPVWAAALIVAAVEGLMAAIFIGVGIKRFKTVRGAPRTIATLKEDVEWAKHPTR
jgi:hypothetical protein